VPMAQAQAATAGPFNQCPISSAGTQWGAKQAVAPVLLRLVCLHRGKLRHQSCRGDGGRRISRARVAGHAKPAAAAAEIGLPPLATGAWFGEKIRAAEGVRQRADPDVGQRMITHVPDSRPEWIGRMARQHLADGVTLSERPAPAADAGLDRRRDSPARPRRSRSCPVLLAQRFDLGGRRATARGSDQRGAVLQRPAVILHVAISTLGSLASSAQIDHRADTLDVAR